MESRQWWHRVDPFVATIIAVAAMPVIVAVARAIADHWIPLGDQALLEIRAHDVLTEHHPLVGTASSAALNRADVVPLNHPGPLMFDALALPVRIFGGGAGIAIGVGMINIAAIAIGTAFAARRSGHAGAALAALAFTGLGWAAGSASLYDPYNPAAAMLPTLACLFLAWAAIDGDGVALVWLIGVCTFAVQLNNSYLLFLTPLVLAACAIYGYRSRHDNMVGLRAIAWRAAAVFALLWSQPLLEQLMHGGDGNMARMVKASSVLGNNTGAQLGTQIAAATLTLPPWWGRSEFQGISLFSSVPHIADAGASLLLVVIACAVGCRWAWRRGYGDVAAALLTAGLGTAIGWIAAMRSPMSSFFGPSADYVRWLWPAGVFIWVAAALTAWRLVAAHMPASLDHRRRSAIGVGAIALVGIANVPSHLGLRSQAELDALRPFAVELIDAAAERVDAVTVLYRPPPNYDVFGPPLLARLDRQGTEFLVDDPVLVRQFGDGRRHRGEVVPEIHVVTAMDAVDAAGGPSTVSFVSALTQDERDELQTISFEIATWLLDGRVTLSEAGQAAVEAGFGEPWLAQLGDPELDAASISRSNALAASVQAGLLDADPQILTAFRRFVSLRQAVEDSTAAVLLLQPENL